MRLEPILNRFGGPRGSKMSPAEGPKMSWDELSWGELSGVKLSEVYGAKGGGEGWGFQDPTGGGEE